MKRLSQLELAARFYARTSSPEARKELELLADRYAELSADGSARTLKVTAISGVSLVLLYALLATHAKISDTSFVPKGKIVVQLIRPFTVDHYAAIAGPNQVLKLADTADNPMDQNDRTSPVQVYEDGTLLGPAHENYANIRDFGGGRYVHWKNTGIVFSSSDNTDPNVNKRKYFAVVP